MLDTERQGRVAKEAPQQLGVAIEAPPLAADVSADLVHRVGRNVREPAVLQVASEQLDGIELGSVGPEPDGGPPPWVAGEPSSDEGVVVRIAAIPHQEDGTVHVPGERG
jgi:hypothetical protein